MRDDCPQQKDANTSPASQFLKLEKASALLTSSIKCWFFGKLLRQQLNQVSNDQALIDATVSAAVALCNVADELGWI